MHVIVTASNAHTRQRLRAKVLDSGLPCDEDLASPRLLEEKVALLREQDSQAIVVVAVEDDAVLARQALGLGLPVMIWPTAQKRGERMAPSREQRRLTAREREILAQVAAGTSNKGIARSLRISPNTVKFHMTTLFAKLGVATRAEAIAAAARSGELSL